MKLYPIGKKHSKGFLQVSSLHTLYYECYGNPKGKPVLVFHGGPGSRIGNKKNKFFHPKKWNIVHFDQRGCGKSLPSGELTENTTMHLVEDTKKLMQHLTLKKAMLMGGSWGSTIALAFALKYPHFVTGLVLTSIYLGTRQENEYMYYGASQFFPEEVEQLLQTLPVQERSDAINAFYKKVLSPHKSARKFAMLVNEYECVIGDFKRSKKPAKLTSIAPTQIMLHYEANDSFLPPDYILKHASRLHKKPVSIIHGRVDMLCRPIIAYTLHKAIKGSRLYFAPKTGHGSSKFTAVRLLSEIKYMEKNIK